MNGIGNSGLYSLGHGNGKLIEEKLSKLLCYVLRYGAKREGLHVYPGGYVDMNDVLGVKMMKRYTLEDVLNQVDNSISSRGTRRFETRVANKQMQIRASHGQSMEANPCHEDSHVTKLVEGCMTVICENIELYNLDDFPDLYLHGRILRKLKREKRLTNKALATMMIPSLERISLAGVYLTERSFDIVASQGKSLKVLNIRGSGYVMNDHILEKMLMKLKNLESLNIGGCVHLTDRSLKAIIKYRPGLLHLSASAVRNLTEAGIMELVTTCTSLEHLDIYDNLNIGKEARKTLVDIASQRKLTVVLKGLTDKVIAQEDPAHVLDIWLEMKC